MTSMPLNLDLTKARRQKNDNFYTQLTDIEKELRHYTSHFKDKVIYCNCDDPTASNFFKYFQLKFRALGIRGLITTCYKNQNPDLFSRHDNERSVGIRIVEQGKVPDLPEIDIFLLDGDGDFRSAECVDILKKVDIVVTNPPFSLFREYVAQLIRYEKKFLILGHQNAVTYKEIFPLIRNKTIWLGVTNGGIKWFEVDPGYSIKTESRKKVENGKLYFSMGSVNWFTNLDHPQRHENLILYKTYSPNDYPAYDNFNIINVDKVAEIPKDYFGVMGVPITFLDKHNPDQFEVLGIANSARWIGYRCFTLLRGRKVYNRVLIKRKKP